MCPCSATQSRAVGGRRAQGGSRSVTRPPCTPARRRGVCSIVSASAAHARGLPAAHRNAAFMQPPAGVCWCGMVSKGRGGKHGAQARLRVGTCVCSTFHYGRLVAPAHVNNSARICSCVWSHVLRDKSRHANQSTRSWTPCRPEWPGSLEALTRPSAATLQSVVGAAISFEHFVQVSGVADIEAAIAQLNARLAARGALPLSGIALGLRW